MKESIERLEKDMTPILLEDLGMRFTSDIKKYKVRYGLYQCQYCGNEFEVRTQSIKGGNTSSCGCLAKEGNNKSHGLIKHPLYTRWAGMHQRCYNKNNHKYKNYGARGIIVCDEWKNKFTNFYNWAIDNGWKENSGLSLDRIDVNGNYEPNNCRWADATTQARNTRDIKSNNTSGYRGVHLHSRDKVWNTYIRIDSKLLCLGSYPTALEAGKAYERYVRLNNLEHNFTPALTEEEIEELNKKKENK